MTDKAKSDSYNPLLERAYKLSNADEAQALYKEWASRYDSDLNPEEYASPQSAVDAVLREISSQSAYGIRVLDAGCGTGLVGECLNKSQLSDRFIIDGLDLSPAMLDVARLKGIYRDLEIADLTMSIARPDGSYDVTICVGTLTKGHVGPVAFEHFARVTAKGGIIVATVHDDVWEAMQFRNTVEDLEKAGIVGIVSTDGFSMFQAANERGRMVVLRKK